MKTKKLLSVIIAVVMIMQMLPVFASETVQETTDNTLSAAKYYVNDQFNIDGDTQGWAKGNVKSGTQTFNVAQGTAPDGSGALIFTSEGDKGIADGGNEPNIFKELTNGIPLNEGRNIVIKTRFMQAGDDVSAPTAGTSYLRFNQPNNEYLLSNNNIPYSYPNMTTKVNNANAICDWFTLLKMEKGAISYRTQNGGAWAPTNFATVDTLGKWIDATITINSNTDVDITATIDGTTYSKTDGSLIYSGTGPLVSYTLYNDPAATTALSEYPSLDSLTWVSQTKNTVYVDYVQVYELVSVSATTESAIKEDGVFEFEFENSKFADEEVAYVTEDAITIEGVETTGSYDAETQTLTLTPVTTLTGGATYKAIVDVDKLAEDGIIYTGETEFDIKVEVKLPDGFYLDDQFNTSGDTQGWAKGNVKSGTQTFNVTQGTAPDGSGALIFTSEGDKGIADGGNEPNIFKELTEKIPLNEGKNIIIKTRFMQAGDDVSAPTAGTSYLRFNQPNNEYLLSNNNIPYSYPNMTTKVNNANAICDWFTLLKMEKGAISYRTQNGGAWAPTNFATVDTLGKWIDATITINSNTDVDITATIDGTTYSKTDGSLIYSGTGPLVSYTLYNDPAATTALSEYPSLDSLTWVSQTKNTVYVDYIQIYEAVSVKATAKEAIKENQAFTFKFVNASDESKAVNSVPAGVITIDGVETEESYDAETQTLTLTPITALTAGNTYTATVDASKFSAIGITYAGETSFSIRVDEALPEGYYLNDQFNKAGDTQGWVKGSVKSGTAAFTVTQGTAPDGSGALILHTEGGSAGSPGQQPNAFKAFAEKVDFTGKTIVLKTRFMQAGNGEETPSGAGYLKFNQPNNVAFSTVDDMKWNWTNTWNRTDAFPSLSGYNTLCRWFELFEFDTTKLGYMAKNDQKNWRCSTYSAVNTVGKWIEAEVIIKGSEDISITAKIDGVEGEVASGSLNQGFTGPLAAYTLNGDKNATEWISTFTSLDSLTWEATTKNDIYVDYVEIYEVELKDAKAQLLNGSKIEEGDTFKLQFMAEEAMTADAVTGAVTVTGATVTDKSFDEETQTLTVTTDAITAGNTYTVSINKSYLEGKGYAYSGTTAFNVKGIVKRTNVIGSVYATDFEDGIGAWKAGAANEGYVATIEAATDGENGVLKATLPKAGDDTNGGKSALAHLELANGVKYEEGKVVVIKAKVKNTTNTPYAIKLNRPDSLTQAANVRQLNGYTVVSQSAASGSMALEFGGSAVYTYANGNQWKPTHPFNHDINKNKFSFSDVDLTNKWVEWEIVLDGTTNKMNVTAKYDDTVLTTWASENPVSALNPAQALNAEYGKGTNIKTFNGLDSISITSLDTANEGILYIDDVSVEIIKDRASAVSALTVNGNEVKTFVTGDVVVPQFTVDPSISDSYTAISVMFVDGVVTEMYTEKIESEHTSVHTIVSENSFTVPANANVVIKTFLWNTFESMDPIGTMAEAHKSDNITVYVAADGNDGSGTGEVNSPVATLTKAMEIAKSRVAAISGYQGSVTIEMADGTYDVSDTIVVSKATTKIPAGGLFITNAEGAKPVISGGTKLDIKDAVKVTDSAILGRLNSTDAANNLYVIDLSGVNVPSESWPGVKSFGVEALAEAADGITVPDIAYQVSMNGTLMVNSRWPNEGYADAKTVSGNLSSATSENVKNGFTLGCTNTNDWSNANDALIFAFLGNGWATQTTPLAGKANGAVTSKYASNFGVSATHARYYVYNLLEEIDMPYEYYIDRSVTPNKMYFYKPSDVTTGTIAFTTEQKELLNLFSVSNVTVDGLTFENALGSAVSISQGHSNKIKNCEFKNMIADIDSIDNNAILNVFSKNCVVDNNHIYNTNGGIKVGSDTPEKDVKTLAAANNTISNNHIENYGILDKVYVDAIYCMGIGNNILNNEIHNAEHLAMRISGFNHNIQYNEIYDVCKETEDVGAIYMGHTWTSRGNKIANNYFHDIKSTLDTSVPGRNPIAAIFLDDHFAGAYVEGNIFADITGDGVRSNRGREGYFNNNLFVNCTRHGIALSSLNAADSATSEGNYQEYLDNVWTIQNAISDGTYDRDIWMKQFPEFVNTEDEAWVKPEKFTVTNNIAVNTLSGWNGKTLSSGQWIKDLATKIENNEQTTTDPGFNDITNDYTIDNTKLTSIVKNFVDVQFVKMGRNK